MSEKWCEENLYWLLRYGRKSWMGIDDCPTHTDGYCPIPDEDDAKAICNAQEEINRLKAEVESYKAKLQDAEEGLRVTNDNLQWVIKEKEKLKREPTSYHKPIYCKNCESLTSIRTDRDRYRQALEYIANAGLSARHCEKVAREALGV